MANIKSAKKRILQNLKKYEFNKFRKSKIRSSIKKVHNLVTDKNKTQETQRVLTENQLLEMDIDEMVIDDAYDTDQVEFYHEGEEFVLENPRFYDTLTRMKGI